MQRKSWFQLILAISLIALVVVGVVAVGYYRNLPNNLSQHETILLGSSRLSPDSTTGVRVIVRDHKNGAPLPNAQVKISLQAKGGGAVTTLFSGITAANGSLDAQVKIPATTQTEQIMVVETQSSLGSDRLEKPITVERDYRVLLTTDKPIYQPGQVIHLRALALSSFDLKAAANQALEITIADAKGNKVFRTSLQTTAYGVAATDFELASEVNQGAYKISAKLGNTSSEKIVTVESYTLPKFDLQLSTTKPYYLPGEAGKGQVKAVYFYGKPVAGGKVHIEGYTFDVQKNKTISIDGVTGADGVFSFDFELPPYLTGSDLDKGAGKFYLEATVTDLAQQFEVENLSLPVTRSGLVIEAMPEAGQLRPGVENIIYVLTNTPDGAPVEAALRIFFPNNAQAVEVSSGPYGMAAVRYKPQTAYDTIRIEGRDKTGRSTTRQFQFQSNQYQPESVLLRPDKPVYKVGEAMKLTVLTAAPSGTVYLDIVREGQVISTRSVEVSSNTAEVVVDLTPDLFGTLELHAYKVLNTGQITRDTRLVVVDQASALSVALTPGQQTYRPGDSGLLNIAVTKHNGQGVSSAVGLAIVDESVFALASQDPGFARLYFMLEKELLTPRYDLHGYSLTDLVTQGSPTGGDIRLVQAVNAAAQASLADVSRKTTVATTQINSYQQNVQRANEMKAQFFNGLSTAATVGLIALAAAAALITLFALRQRKVLGSSLGLLVGLFFILAVLFVLIPLADGARTEFGGWWLQKLTYADESILLLALSAGLLGLLGLVITAFRKDEGALRWLLLLSVAQFVLVYLAFVGLSSSSNANEEQAVALLLVLLALPLVYLLRFCGFSLEKRALPAIASFLMVPALLVLGLGAGMLGVGSQNMVMNDFGGPMGLAEGGRQAIAPLAAPAPMATQRAGEVAKGGVDTQTTTGSAVEAPRLRQYFPETMLWLPDAVTAPDGRLTIKVPIADSITTWRVTALASTQDGLLGSATGPMRVFQDFFIDLDLPTSLTVGDEISLPVGVFNYLSQPQTVRLELDKAGWFELLDEPVKQVKMEANEIGVVYFRLRATQFGRQPFKVTAYGTTLSDAILKEVTVYPNGKLIQATSADRLAAGTPTRKTIVIPQDVISGTAKMTFKLYPGMFSQVVEGLDGILRMPGGCFEQTSSSAYPNVLVMDYLKSTRQASPEVQLKAEQYINLGYQRLTTFEVSGGGFSLFGQAPADRMLTAYGLQEFSDMSRVHNVDQAILKRSAQWLYTQQNADGSWKNDRGLVHEQSWSKLGNDQLPVTAYIAWSLVEAGFGSDAQTVKALAYISQHQAEAKDAYVVALTANALSAADRQAKRPMSSATLAVLDRLASLAERQGDAIYWQSGIATFMGSKGQAGSVETTALAVLALQNAERNPELVNAALTHLIRQKDAFGTWYNTQATVLSLKALLNSVRLGGEQANATVTVTLNGGRSRTLQITPQNFDVVQQFSFDDLSAGEYALEVRVEGKGNLMYQATSAFYMPWDKLAKHPELSSGREAMRIDVKYDRTTLAVNDQVNVNVKVELTVPGSQAQSAVVDLGVPPGFAVDTDSLALLVEKYRSAPAGQPSIQRYELTGRQIILYLANLNAGQPLSFSYALRAKFPLSVQTPASSAYDYYNPDVTGQNNPQAIVVKP